MATKATKEIEPKETEAEKKVRLRKEELAARTGKEPIIYLLPEPYMDKNLYKMGYGSNTVDIPFYLGNFIQNKNPKIPGKRTSVESVRLSADYTYEIELGIRTFAPKEAEALLLFPRSSTSLIHDHGKNAKEKQANKDLMTIDMPSIRLSNIKAYKTATFRLANTIGYMDWDYRGEWMARIMPKGSEWLELRSDRTYLQIVPKNPGYTIELVDSINDIPSALRQTARGLGGFGSTDQF